MSKTAYHESVAQKIIEQLKQGTAPWLKPWKPGEPSRLLPVNPTTGKRYRGINALHLMSHEYGDNRWMTYRQAQGQGAQVRKGEKGTTIQFWQFHDDTAEKDENGNGVKVRLERPRVFFATVFNATQIDNLPPLPAPQAPWAELDRAEAILLASGARLNHTEVDRAYYRPATDSIHLPAKNQFSEAAHYYATALHELAHWTGHPSRLDRDLAHPFGSEGYAREELRAEIASLLLGDELGIGHDPGQHTAYIKSWINVLENDPLEIFRAAADAEKIQTHLLSLTQTQEHSLQTMEERPQETPAMQSVSQEKTRLIIPYAEKDRAKQQAGTLPDGKPAIFWDRRDKCWYANARAPLDKLQSWLPANQPVSLPPAVDIQREFTDTLESIGCIVSGAHPHMDGNTHRIVVEGDKPGQKSGFYIAHTDGLPAGYVKNNRTGEEARWKSKGYTLTDAQKSQLTAEAVAKRQQREESLRVMHQQTATRIKEKLSTLVPVTTPTPYLKKKAVPPFAGIFTDTDGKTTCIPVIDKDGNIWSMQYIAEGGTKRFAKNSRKEGCFHVLGGLNALAKVPVIVIAEGYATAATLAEATGFATVSAFDAGNLKPVAKALRERFPDKPILIAGDDDRELEKTRQVNPGKTHALEAAEAVGGRTVFPAFSADCSARHTDFNDLCGVGGSGKGEVRRQITFAIQEIVKAKKLAGNQYCRLL
ncbi:DNA primase TraC [Legionella geestiana]|uniref:DNA primase TraC n=1 Tax=Legionella geestiana TaxID=45065 RepID=A0A0W0U712_9GAMM|nr:zincin-like metallopeptidase domain-containing protein [Legionella geestiana]KTD03696.1 DNA primase TraC [Legionella geestiana]QBS11533.1 DUF1738 domain-containing protein [Legionella geestiana]STX53798.1 TraC Protein [Legionella geestiana]